MKKFVLGLGTVLSLAIAMPSASAAPPAEGASPTVMEDSPLPEESSDTVAKVYRDMIVVQRKAKNKARSLLFQIFSYAEFADGPEQVNAFGLDLGYAFTEHFEVDARLVPGFLLNDQPIKRDVQDLTLASGQRAYLETPTPRMQYGLDLLWLPAYGKESWGPHSIVRSDTFFRLSVSQIKFSQGTGFSGNLGIGKTFFLSRYFNPRMSAAWGVHDSIVNGTKSTSQIGLLEIGLNWYL